MTARVALFCTNFLPYSQTFIYDQIRFHSRYEVDVFAWRRHYAERFPFPRVHLGGPLYPLRGRSRSFAKVFEERKFDLIHAHFGPAGALASYWAKRYRLPLAVTFHGYDVPILTSSRRFRPEWLPYAASAKKMLQTMDLGLCDSQELLEMLVDYGVPASRLLRHPLGIDLEGFRGDVEAPRRPQVIMIGRFVEKKGLAYGIRAFALAQRKVPEARLVIVGDGELEPKLKALVQELDLSASVQFTGVQSPAQIQEHLRASAVLLAPSVVASWGDRDSGIIVVKEASASGVVPIGTWHGGIPEIIEEGRSGYLVQERDVKGMGERLATLLSDEPLRLKLARGARQKMEREYEGRMLVSKLEDCFDALIHPATPRP